MRLMLSSLLVLVPTIALAQPTKAADVKTMADSDCARARKAGKTCVLSIEDDTTIEGSAPKGGGTALTALETGKSASLIRLRRDFIVEILKSAEDLD